MGLHSPMTFCAPSLVTPRQSCILFAGFLGVLIACIAMPRALCFLPAVYGVGALVFLWCKTRTKPVLDKNLACWLTAILALSGLSAIWAIDPAFALERSIKTACVFLSCYGIIVMARNIPQNLSGKDILAATGVVLCAVSALSIFMEYKTGFFITRHFVDAEHNNTNAGILNGFILNRNLVYLILLCLPVTLMLYLSGLSKKTKIILGASLLACLLMVLSCTKSQTAQISAVVAIIMVFYPAHKKKARQAMALGIVTVMLAMPFIIQPAYTQYLDTEMAQEPSKLIREASVVHRLEVWNFIAGKALEQPFLGHGTESTRFMKSETRM